MGVLLIARLYISPQGTEVNMTDITTIIIANFGLQQPCSALKPLHHEVY